MMANRPGAAGAAIALLLIVLGFSGCLGSDDPVEPKTPPGAGETTPTGPGSAVPTNETGPLLVPHNVPIDITWSTDGIHGPYAGWDYECNPLQPVECELVAQEIMVPDDNLVINGTFLDTGRVRPDSGSVLKLYGTWVLSGGIAGCASSGNVTFPYVAAADEDMPLEPNPSGEVFRGYEVFTEATESDGVVVTAAELRADFVLNPVTLAGTGTLVGTLTCL